MTSVRDQKSELERHELLVDDGLVRPHLSVSHHGAHRLYDETQGLQGRRVRDVVRGAHLLTPRHVTRHVTRIERFASKARKPATIDCQRSTRQPSVCPSLAYRKYHAHESRCGSRLRTLHEKHQLLSLTPSHCLSLWQGKARQGKTCVVLSGPSPSRCLV